MGGIVQDEGTVSAHPTGSCKAQTSGNIDGTALAQAGFVVAATEIDRRIEALGTVVGSNVGRLMREGFSEYNPMGMLEAIAAQRTAEARGQAQVINDLLPPSVAAAKQAGVTDIDVLEANDYYKTDRGQARGGKTSFNFGRQAALADGDAYDCVEVFLTQPLCVVIGDKPGAFARSG
ncbi:hypothetical protein [Nocardia sp. MW-W600-9]